jgi:hypothetical protein
MSNVTEFFTSDSMLVLGTASVGVLVVTNALKRVFGFNPIFVCFVFSLIICFVGAFQVGKLTQLSEYLITFVNSCLLFCTTTGMQEFAGGAVQPRPVGSVESQGKKITKWFDSWVR